MPSLSLPSATRLQTHREIAEEVNVCSVLLPTVDGPVADAAVLTHNILEALQHCPTQSYLILEQPGVSAADYLDASSTPRLSQYMRAKHDAIRSTFSVADVVNRIDANTIHTKLQSMCATKDGAELPIYRLSAPSLARKYDLHSNGNAFMFRTTLRLD